MHPGSRRRPGGSATGTSPLARRRMSATPQAQPRSPLEAGARVPARLAPRPRSAWALAAIAARLYGRSPIPFLLPVALVEIPLLALTTGVLAALDPGPTVITADWVLRFTIFTLADSLLTLNEAVFDFLLLAIIAVQVAARLDGRALPLRAALRAVLPRLGALLGGSSPAGGQRRRADDAGHLPLGRLQPRPRRAQRGPEQRRPGGAPSAPGSPTPLQDLWLRLFFRPWSPPHPSSWWSSGR